ncbi:MAG: HesA/MoeB/ThiF family protein [Halanaerobium sp.]
MKDYLKRQLGLFTEAEREIISDLNVMIAGAGGLGTNQAIQLQRIGINKIYLYDYDKVEVSNLNRQLCYGREDIGRYKVEASVEFLRSFSLDTEIIPKQEKITEETELPVDLDIIFDALDNFETRFILEDLAEKYNLPLIHAGVEGFFAQLMLILPGGEISLKDIFAGAQKNYVPDVFSPAVTITASFQVTEALKYLLGREEVLKNEILHIDMINNEIDRIQL